MKRRHQRNLFCSVSMVALTACLILGLFARSVTAGVIQSSAWSDSRIRPLQLILLPEEENWLILASAPVVAMLKETGQTPVLLAVSSELTDGQTRLLNQLLPLCNSCTVLSLNQAIELPDPVDSPIKREMIRGSILLDTTLLLAKKYWQRTPTVVLCQTKDTELGILAATMAAHMKVPLLIGERETDWVSIPGILQGMNVSKVLVAGNSSLVNTLTDMCEVEQIDVASMVSRTVRLIGANSVRNVVLIRTPNTEESIGNSSWIAPYLSVMRRAPVVACSSSEAKDAESLITELIEKYTLKPKTVTILADYDSLGTLPVSDPEHLGEYQVNIEPCSGSLQGGAAALGVGRIPFKQIVDASRMIACTIAHEVILKEKPARVVMIANPSAAYGSLPLAEVVSRITAEEFKNVDVEIAEFYGQSSNHPDVVDVVTKANLIIYEGHISDQRMFEDPYEIYESPEDNTEFYYSDEHSSPVEPTEYHVYTEQDSNVQRMHYDELPPDESASTTDWEQDDPSSRDMESDIPYASVERFLGLPVLVLQSCHSLEESTCQRVLELGGVGLVGSVTNIHSASGSAFIKAFCDGLLYRNETVGEAVRDARNYFLCLAALKKIRGHQETAKVHRVALSFSFWGDPEMRLFPQSLKAKKKMISAKFTGPQTVKISTPRSRLPEARSEKYFVRMFPGSQVAGIVKRLKNKPIRRLTPLYFSRLAVPAGFDAGRYRFLERDDNSSDRSVFLAEPFKRFIYVLYFPEKETKSATTLLQFVE